MKQFVDTNVLLYSAVEDPGESTKAARAIEILATEDCALSVQVLQEFYTQAIRDSRKNRLSPRHAMEYIAQFCEFAVQDMTLDVFQAALATAHRYKISYWDAAIVEAARALGCVTVLSEDLQHGQNFGGVRVLNPFR